MTIPIKSMVKTTVTKAIQKSITESIILLKAFTMANIDIFFLKQIERCNFSFHLVFYRGPECDTAVSPVAYYSSYNATGALTRARGPRTIGLAHGATLPYGTFVAPQSQYRRYGLITSRTTDHLTTSFLTNDVGHSPPP